ncbi:glycosyltransferase [Klebsiella pneumoniae]|uniref:glycosyltransferase n=1 Tax=Klebsiella pneumoniae TaxID=573 RepID=UPI0029CAB8BE|nr:glycosyltransferase [Klebsiella pneumoniae]
MFAGKKSAQIREILISESAWEEMTCLFAPSLEHMQNAKAFVFAAEEDFGITPVEAQACGTPVIAFGKGGSLETIRPLGVDNPTGLFFSEQTIESIISQVNAFERNVEIFEPENCRLNSLREGANKQVISSQADSLIKISRIWADFFPANTSNQPI